VITGLVLALALVGTAIAGPDALTRQITKSKVRTIARKQADNQITSRAPGLSVAHADTAQSAETAQTAATAQTAVSADPTAFAHVSSIGVVDGANSKGVNQANVTVGSIPGYYCFSGLAFTPKGGVATIDWDGPNVDSLATVAFGTGGGTCPAATQLFVDTRNPNATGTQPAGFFLILYR
jgi:hypothetical protein